MKTSKRRQELQEALLQAGETMVEIHGLSGLKARELAAEAGCALGAIYTVFPDLDALILALNARTMESLGKHLSSVVAPLPGKLGKNAQATATQHLIDLALAYLDFAAANLTRWRAVFDHRMPGGQEVPEWYVEETSKLFAFIEKPMRLLKPSLNSDESALLARSLFSATHGIVSLGLEEKIGSGPLAHLNEQIVIVVTAIANGLRE